MIIYIDDSYHRVFRPLQSATAYFVAKCDSLLLQSATILLASLTVIIHNSRIFTKYILVNLIYDIS